MAIPKMIHYCWISDEPVEAFPELIKNCHNSWGKVMPDYEIIRWDTERFDVSSCVYTAEAFKHKKYAFVSDYIRLYALYHYGGIYLDRDVEVVKRFDPLLNHKAFTGFGNKYSVATWLMASEKDNPLFEKLLKYYDGIHFEKDDGTIDLTPNPISITKLLIQESVIN